MHIASFLAEYPLAFVITCLLLGMTVGSFLNVVIYRLPLMMEREFRDECRTMLADEIKAPTTDTGTDTPEAFNLFLPNSHCPNCNHEIKPWENLPVLSYLMLGGKCAACKSPISKRYPIVEMFTGVLSAWIGWHFAFSWEACTLIAFTWALIAASIIDLDHMLLPDDITLPLLWAGLIVNSFGLFTDLPSALWGAVWGYLSLWSVYWGFKLLTGKEGMGYGDFKLLAALGAWLGWQQLPAIILLSSVSGAVIGVAVIGLGLRERDNPIPFGPFLAVGGWLCAIWGEEIQGLWLGG